MDFNERFIKTMERHRSRAASTSTSTPKQEAREWYLDKNGVVVSKPIENSKAASAFGAGTNNNKFKEIADFIATH